MPGPSGRRGGIDLLRVVGVAAIVAGHVWSGPEVRLALYTWHVPVFFVLSGFLWTDGRSFTQEVARRARTLGRPYVTWLVVIGSITLVTLFVRTGEPPLGAAATMLWGGSGLGRPMSAFWFVTTLFGSAVVFRLLEHRWWWPAILGVGGVLLCTTAPVLVRSTPLSMGLVPLGVGLLLVGRSVRDAARRTSRPGALGAIALGAGFVVAILAGQPVDLKASNLGAPGASLLASILVSAGLVLVFGRWRVPPRLGTVATRLAATGFTVVLTHAWVLYSLPAGTPRPLEAVLATVVPWTVALVLIRTPSSPWAVGAPARRATASPPSSTSDARHLEGPAS